MKAKMVVLAALAAMAMGVVGCGGDAKKDATPEGGTAAPTDSAAPTSTPEAAPSAAPSAEPSAAPK